VLGRLPTFPLRIKSLFELFDVNKNISLVATKTSCDILSQAKKTINLENKSYKIENDANKNILFFKQTVASHTLSKYMAFSCIMVYSKSTFKSINTID
jgi:hypothetical protein